jgi:hypothetical protein
MNLRSIKVRCDLGFPIVVGLGGIRFGLERALVFAALIFFRFLCASSSAGE